MERNCEKKVKNKIAQWKNLKDFQRIFFYKPFQVISNPTFSFTFLCKHRMNE